MLMVVMTKSSRGDGNSLTIVMKVMMMRKNRWGGGS